jgi:hypothetical protein
MPTGPHPVAAHDQGDFVIEIQRRNRSASAGSAAHDFSAVFAPFEVTAPTLRARVEEFDAPARERIAGVRLRTLGVIAQTASQPEIFFRVLAASGTGDDVFHFQYEQHVTLLGQAVAATMTG